MGLVCLGLSANIIEGMYRASIPLLYEL